MKSILFAVAIHILHLHLLNIFVKCNHQTPTITTKINDWERIPLPNGTFVWLHRLQIEQNSQFVELSAVEDNGLSRIFFKLFTNSNPTTGKYLTVGNKYLLSKSNFNPNHPTRIIIHGWINHFDTPVNKVIRKAYLKRGAFNVISMDWSSISSRFNYIGVRNIIGEVGHVLSKFILFLHQETGMSFSNLYLIGHSLGAHVAGMAGKFLNKKKINTIIGLDPAGPLFQYSPPSERLSFDDAEYVETIHTDITNYGFADPIGRASFYPNGGKEQPGCSYSTNLVACSHARAYQYFAESVEYVNNMFIPSKCIDFFSISLSNQTCSKHINVIRMGGEPSNYLKANGIYFLSTHSSKPFGIGNLALRKNL